MGSCYFHKLQHCTLYNSENANMQIYRLWPSALLAWKHLQSLTASNIKNNRIISPAELMVKCLAVNFLDIRILFLPRFSSNFPRGDCRNLCLERIFWALQAVLHIILIKGTNEFTCLSAELLHMFSCVPEAPHSLWWELGTDEGCPEKNPFALLAESGPVSALEFQPSLRYLPEISHGAHSAPKNWRKDMSLNQKLKEYKIYFFHCFLREDRNSHRY